MTSPMMEVGRPLSSRSSLRPTGLVAVDIPLLEDTAQATSTINDTDKGWLRCDYNAALLLSSCPNRPHYGFCPSVRPSVCRSACPLLSLNSNTKMCRKTKIGVDVFQDRSNRCAYFEF